jgi:hypothetical protein
MSEPTGPDEVCAQNVREGLCPRTEFRMLGLSLSLVIAIKP